jgi:hypothetical protein
MFQLSIIFFSFIKLIPFLKLIVAWLIVYLSNTDSILEAMFFHWKWKFISQIVCFCSKFVGYHV